MHSLHITSTAGYMQLQGAGLRSGHFNCLSNEPCSMFSLFERSMGKYHPYLGKVSFALKLVHGKSSWGCSACSDAKGFEGLVYSLFQNKDWKFRE